jgi:hypothetical protein
MAGAKERILNAGHLIVAGSLITLSAAGLGSLGYGVYRLIWVRPREMFEAREAAKAAAAAIGGAPATAAAAGGGAAPAQLR